MFVFVENVPSMAVFAAVSSHEGEMFGVKSAFLSRQRHVNLEHISCKSFRNVKLIERSLRSTLFQKYFEPSPAFRLSLTRQIPKQFHSLPNND